MATLASIAVWHTQRDSRDHTAVALVASKRNRMAPLQIDRDSVLDSNVLVPSLFQMTRLKSVHHLQPKIDPTMMAARKLH